MSTVAFHKGTMYADTQVSCEMVTLRGNVTFRTGKTEKIFKGKFDNEKEYLVGATGSYDLIEPFFDFRFHNGDSTCDPQYTGNFYVYDGDTLEFWYTKEASFFKKALCAMILIVNCLVALVLTLGVCVFSDKVFNFFTKPTDKFLDNFCRSKFVVEKRDSDRTCFMGSGGQYAAAAHEKGYSIEKCVEVAGMVDKATNTEVMQYSL